MATSPHATKIGRTARKLKGRPVCVVMHDGSYYVGWITGIGRNEFVLSANKGKGKYTGPSALRAEKARISGMLPAIGAMLGGGGGNAASGGAGGAPSGAAAGAGFGGLDGLMNMMGMIQKFIPMFKMGFGMVKTIMPLLGGSKA